MSEGKCQKHKNFRIYCASAFVIYLLIVLYITIFSREPEERRIDMELFRSYKLLFIDKNDFYYTQIVCNIIMTVPFGILFPVLNEKFRSVFLMFVSGFVFSLLIELAQYLSYRVREMRSASVGKYRICNYYCTTGCELRIASGDW